MKSDYTVQLEVYEGPLDLLLQLIEREELDITRVALAKVTDQYLAYLEQFPGRPIDELAEFLVVAAKLIQIKSEALLPRPPEREDGEEDPGDALARQLILYRRFKEVATALDEREQAGLRSYLRLSPPPRLPTRLEIGGIGIEQLQQAMAQALAGMPVEVALDGAVEPPKILIRDKIHRILDALVTGGRVSFLRLLDEADTRLDVVVTFLAILELVKTHRVRAYQPEPFADIQLERGEEFSAYAPTDSELPLD